MVRLLHEHWYTRTSWYQILSLFYCHPYWPTDTLNTILHVKICYTIPLLHVVSPWHRYWDSRHYYCMIMNYWYTDTLVHWIPSCAQLLHVLTSVLYKTHWCTCIDCLCLLVTWIMDYIITHEPSCILVILPIVYVTWIIVTWVVRLVFPLHDYFPFWYWYSRYWIHELLICDVWNPTSIVPVSRYRVSCYQQSSCHVIVLHVPCSVLVPDILYSER